MELDSDGEISEPTRATTTSGDYDDGSSSISVKVKSGNQQDDESIYGSEDFDDQSTLGRKSGEEVRSMSIAVSRAQVLYGIKHGYTHGNKHGDKNVFAKTWHCVTGSSSERQRPLKSRVASNWCDCIRDTAFPAEDSGHVRSNLLYLLVSPNIRSQCTTCTTYCERFDRSCVVPLFATLEP